jgi:hypothetical protein
MFFSGGGADLPLPNTPVEWLGLVLAIVLVIWLIRRWLDQG